MAEAFRVGLTKDFLKPDGSFAFNNIGLHLLDDDPSISREFLVTRSGDLRPEEIRGYDALLVLAPNVTAASLVGADRLLLVARFGVGYDNVDIGACTRAGVMVTITPDGVRRPVATSVVGYMLALSLRMLDKDRLIRAGRWADKLDYMGIGLTRRTLGIIGLGNIGREIVRLARPLDMRFLAFDPYLSKADATDAGVELVDLETLLRASDFISINCALTADTHHLLDQSRLALMKPTAYVINTARGPIVDQQALTAALVEHRLAGAALDVFESEPIAHDDPLLRLDNVILAPHAICWTDECFQGNGESACRSIVDVAAGRAPRFLVDRQALDHPRVQARVRAVGTPTAAVG
jgi:D-3-phosphoglycerate dehydrogenase